MNKAIRDILINTAGSVIGGLILALLFLAASDFAFKPPDLNGRWRIAMVTDRSSYTNYIGMVVLFEVMLHQNGNQLEGTAEKVAEISRGDLHVYDYSKRVRIELAGSIDRNYLSRDTINLHWMERGRIRESSSFLHITRFNDSYMRGSFESTISNGSGRSEWARDVSRLSAIDHNHSNRIINLFSENIKDTITGE